MTVQIKKNIDEPKTLKKQQPNSTTLAQPKQPQATQEQIKSFLRQYELKNLSLSQMYHIYTRNALSPFFQNTLKSAFVLIFIPALTNLYYTFRPNSPLASVMPFAMPLVCLTQYFYVINKDFERFCFNNTEDAKELREKYKILYAYSMDDKAIDKVVEDIIEMEQEENKKATGKGEQVV